MLLQERNKLQNKIVLRYYQEEAISSTFKYINSGGRAGLAVLPTGSGKSLVIAELIKRILMKKPHVRFMMLTHVKELIEQNYEKIKMIWPTCPAGIYSAGVGFKQFTNPIIYGGIQSCYRKAEIFGHIDMLLIDEAHLVSDKTESMYGAMINHLKKTNPNLVVIGLTATPFRLGMGYLTNGPMFDDIYYDISTMENFVKLIDEGFLCELVPISTDTQYDLSNVKMTGGEFQEKSLDENVNRDEITREIVLETLRRASDRNKGLSFCVSKSHAENMAMRFTEAGWPSTFIHSSLTKTEREKVLSDYFDGKYKLLTNVGVLTTGFDAPNIDFMVMSRPTESTSLHIQMLGRGMRPHSSKENTLVLDFASNCARLGPINDPVVPVPKGKVRGDAPIRICDQCSAINHASVKFCKQCGFEFPPPKVKFDSKIVSTEIVRRGARPKIEWFDVNGMTFNRHVSIKGNETLKVTFNTENMIMYDMYLSIDPKMGKMYNSTKEWMDLFKFKVDVPKFKNFDEFKDFMSENCIPPKNIRIWLNKPKASNKNKKIKQILTFSYEEEKEK